MSSIPKPHTNLTNFTNRLSSMIQRFDVGTRLSEMAIHNGVVYLAGQIPEDPQLGIEGQTQQVLDAIDKLLARAGSDKSKLLMVQIFLVDLQDFEGMNKVWDAWVVPGHTPPRATVQANLASPKWRLEVVATAAV
jgi:enamine deaminase RidA (YjgF/YER057c/UK114 family)